jgi:hypothetical protein
MGFAHLFFISCYFATFSILMSSKHKYLPEEIIKPATLRSILGCVFGTSLILVLANFAAKSYLKIFPQNEGYWLVDRKWEMLNNLEKPVDWLILGDSSCNQGVVTNVWQEKLQASAINLCTFGDTLALNDALMLAKYIEKYGAPKNILLVHVYDIWNRNINWNVTAQIPISLLDFKRLQPHLSPNLEESKTVFVDRYLPLYSQNESLKNILKNPKKVGKANIGNLQEGGFMSENQTNPGEVEADYKRHINYVKKEKFHLSSANQESLKSIVTLAEKHNFNVYLTNSPIYQGLNENKDFLAYYQQVKKTFQEFDKRSDKVHYIQEPITFPKEQMQNADHLVESSAKVYTKKLAEKIKEIGDSEQEK